ncbi:splicing factor, variant 2 [Basidiobolus ranarum]|uniref:Splicing factor, variant 2 n=1 Tax=Basidiobolus ranarum TaxID=34480 RepID=A0ABR2WAD1_9FUNG
MSTSYSKPPLVNLNDPQVCKNFIVGECPSNLFNLDVTKVENYVIEHLEKIRPPKCQLLHVEELRKIYRNTKSNGDFQKIEQEALTKLKLLVKACDEQINSAKKGLEISLRSEESVKLLTEVNELGEEIITLLNQLEDHIQNSQILEANAIITKLDSLKRTKHSKEANLRDVIKVSESASSTRLTVCDVCGAYLSIHDYGIERRLYDHTEGVVSRLGITVSFPIDNRS